MKRFTSEKILNQIKNLVLRFPVSLILILLLAIWEFLSVERTFQSAPMDTVLITGILLATVSQLFYERFFKDAEKTTIRWLLYTGVLVFLVLYDTYFSMSLDKIDRLWTIYSIPGIRAMIVYYLAILLLAWVPSIKSNIKFSDSFLVVFKGYFASSFFALVLFLGMILVFFLFERLFFSLEMNWFSYTFIFAFNLFLPVFFLTFIPDYHADASIADEKQAVENAIEMPKFLRGLITYIFIPIMAVYTLLLVFYILTNLTTVFFEDNLLEALILTYAINGWVLLILSDSIENKLAQLFKKVFPILLIFVFIFQIIATFMEIQEVGITHGRYFILLFGIGSIISALWYMIKKPRLWLLPIVSLIAGVISLIPPIDAVGLSVRNQVNRVENILEEHNILHDKETILPNPNVPPADRLKVNVSIQYLQGINALNQLTWLSDVAYYDPSLLFGTSEEDLEEEREHDVTKEEPETPVENEIYEVRLNEEDKFSLPVDRYDYMLDVVLEKDETMFDTPLIQDEFYRLDIDLEDGFLVTVESEEKEVDFDFSYILDSFEKENATYSLNQMMFTEENEDFVVTIFVKSYQVNRDDFTIEFLLFL